VYTVTVKQSVPATNKAVFTNVADAAVEYIGGTGDKEAQATAIATLLDAATGTLYDAAVGTGATANVITLTALANGAKTKPEVKVENYTAPVFNDVTGETAANVTAGDTALAVTATGGELKTGLKVFVSTDGGTVTITTATSVDGAIATGSTATVAQDGLKIIVKGLTAAADSPNNTTGTPKLKSSAKAAIVIKGDAQTTQVTSVTATTGKPVAVVAQAYTVGDGTTNDTIKFTAGTPNKVKYNHSGGTAVSDTNLDADFDAALIAVFTHTALGLTGTDTITFGAGGVVSAIGVVATPTAARLTAAFGFAPAVTLGVDLTLTDNFAVPAGKTLTLAAQKSLTVAAGKVLDLSATGAAVVITKDGSFGSVILLPKEGALADGGGAAIKFTAGTTHAQAKGTVNARTVGTSLGATTVFTFAGTTGTDITTLPTAATGEAVIDGKLEAATVVTANLSANGKIVLNGNSSNDATISAAIKFETTN
jgi:hypothetical protein